MKINHNNILKMIIVIFWAVWWCIAFWTDLIGGLAHLGIVHANWAPDTNYPFLVSSLKMYPITNSIPPVLFLGIIIWLFISFISFAWACLGFTKDRSVWIARSNTAFIISLSLWFSFFIADQIVMKFDLEENHMVQGGFQLLTFLVFHLLPT